MRGRYALEELAAALGQRDQAAAARVGVGPARADVAGAQVA
jgi:hypothetical protein